MNYNSSDLCICGHSFEEHESPEDAWCVSCYFEAGFYDNLDKHCDAFKLDNLKYVEEKAKKRKLL